MHLQYPHIRIRRVLIHHEDNFKDDKRGEREHDVCDNRQNTVARRFIKVVDFRFGALGVGKKVVVDSLHPADGVGAEV